MGDVADMNARRSRTKPQKHAEARTVATAEDFMDSDEVKNLAALKSRLAEMLARPDIHERDFSAITKDYMRVIVELKEAEARAEASHLGRSRLRGYPARTFDGDI